MAVRSSDDTDDRRRGLRRDLDPGVLEQVADPLGDGRVTVTGDEHGSGDERAAERWRRSRDGRGRPRVVASCLPTPPLTNWP